MSIKAEFIVNVSKYQHVAVWIQGSNRMEFEREMDDFSDRVKERLGIFQAELESWVIPARQNVLEGVHQPAVEAVKSLGATVVETVQTEEPAAVERPWNRTQPTEVKPKAWTPTKPAALDDF